MDLTPGALRLADGGPEPNAGRTSSYPGRRSHETPPRTASTGARTGRAARRRCGLLVANSGRSTRRSSAVVGFTAAHAGRRDPPVGGDVCRRPGAVDVVPRCSQLATFTHLISYVARRRPIRVDRDARLVFSLRPDGTAYSALGWSRGDGRWQPGPGIHCGAERWPDVDPTKGAEPLALEVGHCLDRARRARTARHGTSWPRTSSATAAASHVGSPGPVEPGAPVTSRCTATTPARFSPWCRSATRGPCTAHAVAASPAPPATRRRR